MLRTPHRSRLLTCLVATTLVLGAGLVGSTAAAEHGRAPAVRAEPLRPDAHAPLGTDRITQLLVQPDGWSFKARLTDPEVGGLFETLDGYGVERDSSQTWRWITGFAGDRVRLGTRVTAAGPPAGLARHLGRHHVDLSPQELAAREAVGKQLQAAVQRMADSGATTSTTDGPRVFYVPALMLATWYDKDAGETTPQFHAPTNTPEYFQKLLDGFGGNPYGSMTQYYYEASFGQFLVRVDVYGTYTSAHSVTDPCYYGTPDSGEVSVTDPVGRQLGLGGLGALGMASEAVPQAADVPWAKYDNDGDGVVDFTMIIHSGGGHEVTGDKCNTHSHAITASSLANIASGQVGIDSETLHMGIPTSSPGIYVNRVVTIPEFESKDSPLTIGVATHEMAHAIGEPDYYDTSYSSVGTGDFDIMSGGSYLGNPSGSNPAMQNPATRVFQHFVTPTIVHGSLRGYTLQPRTALPAQGYRYGTPDPNLLLVPTYEISVGDTDALGHTWTDNDVYGLARDPQSGKYVVEGYYVENVARNATSPRLDPQNPMGSMFDRQMHSSGLAVWHFDYWRQSTTYFGGANDAESDPNRYQMDLEEFDQNDNTQELQLNYARGNAGDLLTAAATGITSGTRELPPGADTGNEGSPQDPVELSGTTTPLTPGEAQFTVDGTKANDSMDVTIASDNSGDCKLQLVDPDGHAGTEVDSGGPGDSETVTVQHPAAGTWTARVSDFAVCGGWSGRATFSGGAQAGFNTYGAADTWSNWSEQPTGWAFTNVRGYGNGLDTSQEGGRDGSAMTLDVLDLSDAADVSPGFVTGRLNDRGSASPVVAGQSDTLELPVFSNGGRAPGRVSVVVHRDSATGPVVARRTVDLAAYQRTSVTFPWTPRAEGPARLVAVVDPADRVDEGSEQNQVQVTDLWVGPSDPQVLVVDDDQVLGHEHAIEGSLSDLGVRYATVGAHPSAETLSQYDAVIWSSAVDRYEGQLDAGDRAAIAAYLDQGGRVLLTGNRVMDAITTVGSPQTAADTPAFGAHYFGVRTPEANTTYIVSQFAPATMTGAGFLAGLTVPTRPAAARQFVGIAGLAGAGAGADGETVQPYGQATGIVSPPDGLLGAVQKEADAPFIGAAVDGDAEHGGFRSAVLGWNLGDGSDATRTTAVLAGILDHFGVATGRATTPTRRLIYTTAVRDAVSGQPVTVTAVVLGGHRRAPVTLSYRRHDRGRYYTVPMSSTDHRTFQAVIPGRAVTPDGVDYVLRSDGSRAPYGGPGPLAFSIAVAMPTVAHPLPIR